LSKHFSFIPFIPAGIVFILLKIGFTYTSTADLNFLLHPVASGIEILTNSPSLYQSDTGYYFAALNIIIDKSCSGGHFMMIAYGLFAFLFNWQQQYRKLQVMAIPLSLGAAFGLTIIANISRIYFSLYSHRLLPFESNGLHEAEGILVYFSFLLITYLGMTFLLQRRTI
jgi:exosortase K